MKAGNPDVTRRTADQARQLQQSGWYHSMEWPSGEITTGLQSLQQQRQRLSHFPIPQDLTGKSVLDIGAWDGWFGFELERRGASLTAIDVAENPRYLAAKRRLNSQARYEVIDICDPAVVSLGRFDIVLFLGVLYHVKHPVLALEHVCALTRGLACIESYVIDHGDLTAPPLMEFYEGEELCGQFDNWIGLNCSCLMAMARTAAFAQIELLNVTDQRAHFVAHRQRELPSTPHPAFLIQSFENAATHEELFAAAGDEYITMLFHAPESFGQRTSLFLRTEAVDTPAATLNHQRQHLWQANFRFPPGITHSVTAARLHWESYSSDNTIDIPVGRRQEPMVPDQALSIEILTDGRTWERDQVRLGSGACLSLWAYGLANALIDEVFIEIAGHRLPALYISKLNDQGLSQVNVMIPIGIPPGEHQVILVAQSISTAPHPVLAQ